MSTFSQPYTSVKQFSHWDPLCIFFQLLSSWNVIKLLKHSIGYFLKRRVLWNGDSHSVWYNRVVIYWKQLTLSESWREIYQWSWSTAQKRGCSTRWLPASVKYVSCGCWVKLFHIRVCLKQPKFHKCSHQIRS